MGMGMRPVIRAMLLCSSSFLAFAAPAAAQQAPLPGGAQPPQAAAPSLTLPPVTVTALKRVESAEDMAASVTVVTLDDTPFLGTAIDAGTAITRAAPNVQFGGFGQPGNDYVSIRGIGPLGQPANSLDNTVGFSTNGVGTSAFGFPPSLLDVDRVEVLRGPQGTLFGRNALGGAINVVTKPADGTREFRLTGELGTEGHAMTEAKAGGWLLPGVLAGRAAIRYQQLDGDIPNDIAGGDEGGSRLGAARGTLRFTPNDRFSANFVTSYDQDERRSSFAMLREVSGYPRSGADIIPLNERGRSDTSLEMSYKFDALTLTSVSGYQNIELDGRYDLTDANVFRKAYGFVPAKGADLTLVDEGEQIINQELRINSPEDARISWVAGLNYFSSNYDRVNDSVSSFSPYASGVFDTKIDSRTVSAFGDVSVPVTDRLTLSGGVRVSRDDQDLSVRYTGRGFPGTVAAFRQDSSISDTYVTGRLGASYDWTDAFTTYASVARGYASGGFGRSTINAAIGKDTTAFQASEGLTYETGIKTKMLGGRVENTFGLFYNDISKGQLVSFDSSTFPVAFTFVNQDYDSYGLEWEGRALLTETLSLSGGVGLTKSKLKNTATNAALRIREGNRVPGTPRLTANAEITWDFLQDFSASAQYQFVGSRSVDVQNSYDLASYNMVNLRLGWGDEDFSVYTFANNLLDERPEYNGATYSDTVHSVGVGPGRVIGLGISKTF